MLSAFKLLKLSLPLATVASATAMTAFLVSFKKEDVNLNKENDDKVLEDFERPTEIFEEQKITYPEEEKVESDDDKAETNKKSEVEANEELEKEKRKGLVKELLENPEKLIERLSKDPNAPESKAIIKQIQSEVNEINQNSSKVESADVVEADEGINGDLDSNTQDAGRAIGKEIDARVEEIEKNLERAIQAWKEAQLEETQILENEESSDMAGKENERQDLGVEGNEGAGEGSPEISSNIQEERHSISSPSGDAVDTQGILDDGDEKSSLDKKAQLENLSNLSDKLNDALSQLSAKFNI